jgi:hypothetical protein
VWRFITFVRSITFALTIALTACLAAPVHSQDRWRDGYNDDSYRYAQPTDRAYNNGVLQGQRDRANNLPYSYQKPEWRYGDKNYRQAYRDGYDQGYRSYNYNRTRQPEYNSPYWGNNPEGGYRPNGYAYGDPGSQRGYLDGLRDGQRDQVTGHSYRPTHSDNYEDADRGYHSSFGDKKYYKQKCRNGYVQGYQAGYGSRGYDGYRQK